MLSGKPLHCMSLQYCSGQTLLFMALIFEAFCLSMCNEQMSVCTIAGLLEACDHQDPREHNSSTVWGLGGSGWKCSDQPTCHRCGVESLQCCCCLTGEQLLPKEHKTLLAS